MPQHQRILRPILTLLAGALVFLTPMAGWGQPPGLRYPATVSARFAPASAAPGEVVTLEVTSKLDAGRYQYALKLTSDQPTPTSFEVGNSPAIVPIEGKDWVEPTPHEKLDGAFEELVQYHEGETTFRREFRVGQVASGEYPINGKLRMQICDNRSCLPSKSTPFAALLTVKAGAPLSSGEQAPPVPVAESPAAKLEPPAIHAEPSPAPPGSQGLGAGRGLVGFSVVAFLAGLASLLTPCVFPMIPITISFFTKRAAKTNAQRIGLSGLYAGSIVAGFAVFGFGLALAMRVFGLGVEKAGTINQLAASPVLNLLLTVLFVAFAMSLFGLFELQLPSSWVNRLQQKQRGRTDALGAVLMAVVFVLVSFTCTGPIVGPLIVTTLGGSWLKPFAGLTAYGAGFALPFFLLGLVPQALGTLPKSGGWLNSTKVVMGFLEIAAAFKFISNTDLVWQWGLFTRELVLAAWTAIATVTTIYLLGKIRLPHDTPIEAIGPTRLMFGLTFGTLAFYLAFGLFGGRLQDDLESYLPPDRTPHAATAAAPASGQTAAIQGHFITNDLDRAVALAKSGKRPLFIDFTGWTCTNCRWMEKNMYPRPEVSSRLEKMVVVALYTDDKTHGEKYQEYQAEKFGTITLPYYVILSPDGRVAATFNGMTRDEGEFLRFLDEGIEGASEQLAAGN
ncbi:thioredoxin family protein [Candidatus Poribacteria bacterium]|nr:thioredoxin family protein [Candidatus Poribacteria bacterium]